MRADSLVIVLAEDDDGHATLIERNLRRSGIGNEIVRTRDGQEALDFLRMEGAHTKRANHRPTLLLLDINMPRVDGLGVLQGLRADSRTSDIPVVVLTTTDDPREVQRCYELGCNVYVTKPVAYDDFIEAIRRLGLFLEIVQVPPRPGA